MLHNTHQCEIGDRYCLCGFFEISLTWGMILSMLWKVQSEWPWYEWLPLVEVLKL